MLTKVLKRSLLGLTVLLLLCQVTVSQLCKSVAVLMDGFHTLFILVSVALTAGSASRAPLGCPQELFASPLHASNLSAGSPIKPHLSRQAAPPEGALRQISPPALGCGLSYRRCRTAIVGSFISALLLASLSLSSTIDIIGLFLEPKQVWLPLLLVVASSSSVLLKTLFLWLYWDHFSHTLLRLSREGGAKGQAEPRRVSCDVGQVRPAADGSVFNEALVLWNPATSGPSYSDAPTPDPQGGLHQPAAAPQQGRDEDAGQPEDLSSQMSDECSSESPCDSHGGNNANSSSGNRCSQNMGEGLQKPLCLLLGVLGAAILALINSVALLVLQPEGLHGSGSCSLLVYLDPCLSLLALLLLLATCVPQVSRYGMLLLQATPPHISISDLQRRIESVPGVQAVHDLHIWELTELFWVASVHVHCHADFKTHRCADLISEVVKVLRRVGVSCCTIQPEFASRSCPSVIQREDVPGTPGQSCSLACTDACAASMCCSPSEEEKLPSCCNTADGPGQLSS